MSATMRGVQDGPLARRRGRPRLRSRVDEGNRGREGRAEAERALDRHVAAQQGGELAHEGQPEAGSAHALLHGIVELGELLEDALLVLRRDAHPRVGDGAGHGCAVGRQTGGHPDLAALGELQRVREEVAQDLRHLALVRVQERDVFGLLEHEGHRLVHEQRAQHAAQGGEEVPEIELRRPHDRLARLHRREVEQVVHQLGQVVGGLADIAHLPALLRGERAVAVARAGAPTAPAPSSAACGTRGSCWTESAT